MYKLREMKDLYYVELLYSNSVNENMCDIKSFTQKKILEIIEKMFD